MPTAPKGENAMSVMHHFTRDQARQFGGQFGIDREWRRSSEENDPGDLKMEEYGRYYYPQANVEGKGPSSSAKSRPVCCSKKKSLSGKMS